MAKRYKAIGKKNGVHYTVKKNARTKRFTIFKIDPEKKGFGKWKIVKGGFEEKKHAESWATAKAGIEGLL